MRHSGLSASAEILVFLNKAPYYRSKIQENSDLNVKNGHYVCFFFDLFFSVFFIRATFLVLFLFVCFLCAFLLFLDLAFNSSASD